MPQKKLSFIIETLKLVVLALIIIIPLRTFVAQPFFVRGSSMEPTFFNGEYLIVDELSYHLREPKRGEVIVFRFPKNIEQFYIKRVIGLPGERLEIREGRITIYNDEYPQGFVLDESDYLDPINISPDNLVVTLNDGDYFVLGDARRSSFDSRRWGPVPRKNIIGRAWLRAWPMNRVQAFSVPSYTPLPAN